MEPFIREDFRARCMRKLHVNHPISCRFRSNLVPRAHDPSGLWQGSRALAGPDFLSMRRAFVSYSRPIRFDGKSVNRGLPVLDQARALDPYHWPEGWWTLGTRMVYKTVESTREISLWKFHGQSGKTWRSSWDLSFQFLSYVKTPCIMYVFVFVSTRCISETTDYNFVKA